MEKLYYDKGGSAPVFNGAQVLLTLHDLYDLENALMSGALPDTEGFFFGRSDGSELDGDLEFLDKARRALVGGMVRLPELPFRPRL